MGSIPIFVSGRDTTFAGTSLCTPIDASYEVETEMRTILLFSPAVFYQIIDITLGDGFDGPELSDIPWR
jgi:hypothetical protein